MKYLITGITGFASPHLAKILIQNGHEVLGTYRSKNTDYMSIKDVMGEDIERMSFTQCDLLDEKTIEVLFRNNQFDGVFNLGAFTHPPTSFDIPEVAFRTNALGVVILCEAMRKYNSDCILMQCSTSEVYGCCSGKIDETTPMSPMNPYAVSKASADLYLLERTRNNMIKGFFTRAFSHTGPRRRPNYSISSDAIQVARIIKGLQPPVIKVGNLKAVRNVMDVRDVVDVYYRLMLMMQDGMMKNGDVFNISGNEAHEIGYYLQIMLDLYDLGHVKTEIDSKLFRPIDILVQYPDNTKIKQVLKWKPTIDIQTTLKDLVEYWLKYESLYK